ncbi:MAG: plasma-membrane proton-efflux P-type ATPase [Chitinispirillales bacterium]|jgi:H+-transporting ATPase|nr:plasma-membrane proton-efflux P-type ATPase [Chitinispirillales bacterium]
MAGLSTQEALGRLKRFGFNEVSEKKKNSIIEFLKLLLEPASWMLEVIIVLSFILGRTGDAYIVTALLVLNAVVTFVQSSNSQKAVDTLKQKLQIKVKVLRDREWSVIPGRELVPGDLIRLRMGDFVPADVKISEGELELDQSALTGESQNVLKKPNDDVYSGSVTIHGEATAEVISTGAKTFFGKTIQLVKTAKHKSHADIVIFRLLAWIITAVSSLLLLALAVTYIRGESLLATLPLMLVLLMGAVPVAAQAMFSVSMALGARELVKKGVLVTRLSAPNDAASVDVLCADKTGTLTQNKLSIVKIQAARGFSEDDVARYGAMASQEADQDAIDTAFIKYARETSAIKEPFVQKRFIPFSPTNRRTKAHIIQGEKDFIVYKGAFETLSEECGLDQKAIEIWNKKVDENARSGYRSIAMTFSDGNNKMVFTGLAALHDPPAPDSKELVNELKKMGVSVTMLTGDAEAVARQTGNEVGIGDSFINASEINTITNLGQELFSRSGVAQVYPEDKYKIIKALQSQGHITAMTGDGVNDAPALRQAEVGIAVSGATDAAKAAASIVLTESGLSGIVSPIRVGRQMFERINTWMLVKLKGTMMKTIFVVLLYLITGKFVITATAMLIIMFMTDFVKISLATDNARGALLPDRWRIGRLAFTGAVLGGLMTLLALALFYIGWKHFGVSTNDNLLNTFSFQILLYYIQLSVFIVREKGHFWQSAPSKMLFWIIFIDICLGLLIPTLGLLGFAPMPVKYTLFIFTYIFISIFTITDYVKYLLFKRFFQ